jgi:hypothetical protein
VFWDESGASLLPVTRRTWAPRGHTAVIRHRFKWKRASMAAGLCYGSPGGDAAVCLHHQVGAYHTDTLIGALEGLRRFLRRAEGDAGMGRAARPPQQGDARLAAGSLRHHHTICLPK